MLKFVTSVVVAGRLPGVRAGTIIYEGSEIGEGFSTGHFALIRQHVVIGKNVSIGSYTEIGPRVIIGDNVRIHSRAFIPEHTVIGDRAWLGPGVIITNTPHPLCKVAKECLKFKRVTISEDVIIGAGALILPGVTLHAGSFVAAGAVVTKNVQAGHCVMGHPAWRHLRDTDRLECSLPQAFRVLIGVEDEFNPYPVD